MHIGNLPENKTRAMVDNHGIFDIVHGSNFWDRALDHYHQFIVNLSNENRDIFLSLNSPALIQDYLDSIPYRVEDDYVCVASAFRDGKAHCFDGALLAAAVLWQLGYPPLIVQLLPENDDDHIIAIYKKNGRFGAVSKSNYVGLRSREPAYVSVRELVMSYFNDFYNFEGLFSLRGYSLPLHLPQLNRVDWLSSDAEVQVIVQKLYNRRKVRLFTPDVIAGFSPINSISYQAGMSITNIDGVYKPGTSHQKDFGF